MNIFSKKWVWSMAAILMIAACSDKPANFTTTVQGTITVADSVDGSGDYSGINVLILQQDSSEGSSDTLYHEVTNNSGFFTGKVSFPEKKYYRMSVSRNNNHLGDVGIILAHKDTVTLSAELPGWSQTVRLQSLEHDAMRTFLRVDEGFQRIRNFASRGTIADTQFVEEVQKWTGLYWQVYQENEGTLGGLMAAEQSVRLLSTWNPDKMLSRIDSVLPADYMTRVALQVGHPYVASEKGFDAASAYLDSLSQITANMEIKELISREKIKLYFDSSRVRAAKQLLNNYENLYADNPASNEWAKSIRYDLNYLAPGVKAPDFSFVTMAGDSVSNEHLEGQVYILEISPLANAAYQNDFDRTLIIHEIYRNYGLKIFTIPLDRSEITVNAFFEERSKLWPVAKLGSFDVQEIIRKFNVVQVPTRLLIDKNGVLIRKYEGREFEDIIQGINRAFRNNNSPS